jgi:hypothetical protein
VRQFARLYGGIGAPRHSVPLVTSLAFVFAAEEGAGNMLALADELLEYSLGLSRVTEVDPPVRLGSATRGFATSDALVRGLARQPGVAIVWRDGALVAAVFVGGLSGGKANEAVSTLARREQARIAAPTLLTPSDTDDRDVALDHPALRIPIFWLGRRFDTPGLPEPELSQVWTTLTPGSGPGSRLKIDYAGAGSRGQAAGIELTLWTPLAWKRFLRKRLGRLVWGSPCARARTIRLARGRAVIYSGYDARRTPRPCPRKPLDRFLAHVYLGKIVVGVNLPNCFNCLGEALRRNPYNSVRGMQAAIRGLRLRR